MQAAQTNPNTYQKLITLFLAGRNHNTSTAYHLDLRISVHADHRFRSMPIAHFGPSRSLISVHADHRFR